MFSFVFGYRIKKMASLTVDEVHCVVPRTVVWCHLPDDFPVHSGSQTALYSVTPEIISYIISLLNKAKGIHTGMR